MALSTRASATADRAPATAAPTARPPAAGLWHTAWRRFLHDRPSMIALVVLGLIALSAVSAPWVSDHVLHTDPARLVRRPDGRIATLQPPGPAYPLGTDELGRDTLTR